MRIQHCYYDYVALVFFVSKFGSIVLRALCLLLRLVNDCSIFFC